MNYLARSSMPMLLFVCVLTGFLSCKKSGPATDLNLELSILPLNQLLEWNDISGSRQGNSFSITATGAGDARFQLHLEGVQDTGSFIITGVHQVYFSDDPSFVPLVLLDAFLRITEHTPVLIKGELQTGFSDGKNPLANRYIKGAFGVRTYQP